MVVLTETQTFMGFQSPKKPPKYVPAETVLTFNFRVLILKNFQSSSIINTVITDEMTPKFNLRDLFPVIRKVYSH